MIYLTGHITLWYPENPHSFSTLAYAPFTACTTTSTTTVFMFGHNLPGLTAFSRARRNTRWGARKG